jgi:hypothetical protein
MRPRQDITVLMKDHRDVAVAVYGVHLHQYTLSAAV